MPPIEELIQKFEEFQQSCKTVLPGVARRLIEDLILHQQEILNAEYMYKIEIFTRKDTDVNKFNSKMQYWIKQACNIRISSKIIPITDEVNSKPHYKMVPLI